MLLASPETYRQKRKGGCRSVRTVFGLDKRSAGNCLSVIRPMQEGSADNEESDRDKEGH